MILVSVLFLITSLYMIREIEKQSGQIGVRFTQEVIDPRKLNQLYEEAEDEEWPRVTLWKQTEHVPASYEELNREVLLKLVDIWGDVEQVYPDCLSAGAPLIRDDEEGCMLTGQAAEELFGGTDVIGMHLMLEEKEYIIRGILDIPEEIFIRENSNTSYTFVEAEGHPRGGTEKLRQMLVSVGASLDDGAVVETDTFCGILKVLWLLPAFLLLYCTYRSEKQMCGGRKLLVWILRILAVVIVVIILWHSWGFSEDFIPSKWSDLEFFGDLFKAQRENYNRYLDVAEVYKDRILFACFKRALIWDGAFLIWDVVFLILPRPKLTFALSLSDYPIRKSIMSHPSEFIRLLSYLITEPNGISASLASLNCCRPKGIPTIVTHRITPMSADSAASQMPETASHIILSSSEPAPPPYSTSFPNGKKLSEANLKHCIPTGIPTIVIHHRQPASAQLSPLIHPPKINHKILPRHPIDKNLLSKFIKHVAEAI